MDCRALCECLSRSAAWTVSNAKMLLGLVALGRLKEEVGPMIVIDEGCRLRRMARKPANWDELEMGGWHFLSENRVWDASEREAVVTAIDELAAIRELVEQCDDQWLKRRAIEWATTGQVTLTADPEEQHETPGKKMKAPEELDFQPFARLKNHDLFIEAALSDTPAVYIAVLEQAVFWVGETSRLRSRFRDYQRWLALPRSSSRRDAGTRDQLISMLSGRELIFFWKEPDMYRSPLTGKSYPAHRVEETALIDHFRPAWNLRKGGRREGAFRKP